MKKMMMTIAVMMTALVVCGADAPSLIPFQGRLTNQQGEVYKEGQYTLIFNIYDTAVGGTSLWTERHEGVGVINGMVNLFLGSIKSLESVDFSKTCYLGITIDADGNANSYDPEMVPRQMIIPSFYAKNAQNLQGSDWSAVLTGDANDEMSKRSLRIDKIQDGAVAASKIASESITTDRIKNGTILAEDLAESVASVLMPPGTILPFAGGNVPNGWLLCDGRSVSASAYPKLYEAIGTTWGGSGSSFNLPNLLDRTLWGASGTGAKAVGKTLAAGLPNITGAFVYTTDPNREMTTSGAFTYQQLGKAGFQGSSTEIKNGNVSIDASRSSSIYGNSSTVQPPAACVNFIIKY